MPNPAQHSPDEERKIELVARLIEPEFGSGGPARLRDARTYRARLLAEDILAALAAAEREEKDG